MNVIPITAQEAILRIREGAHAHDGKDALTDELLIGALERGYISAGLDEQGRLVFTKEA